MRILLTGASSFTGFWFATTLAGQGHEVVAPITMGASAYDGTRAQRVFRLADNIRLVPKCRFGDDTFLALAREPFDIFCHHGATVGDYRSAGFDIAAALGANTRALRTVLARLHEGGLRSMVLTGSVFEPDTGIGEDPGRAVSAYGLSKHLTAEVAAFYCADIGIPFHRFTIANPFGPWEEQRFCHALLERWRTGETARVRTPLYLRDNIHVDLLALAYADFVRGAASGAAASSFGPQGYCESQGAFAERFARAMRERLGLACALSLLPQCDFPEPRIRFNETPIDPGRYGWNEGAAWDGLASYYREAYRLG